MSDAFLTINPDNVLFIRRLDAHRITEAAGTEDVEEIIRLINVGREAERQRAEATTVEPVAVENPLADASDDAVFAEFKRRFDDLVKG